MIMCQVLYVWLLHSLTAHLVPWV